MFLKKKRERNSHSIKYIRYILIRCLINSHEINELIIRYTCFFNKLKLKVCILLIICDKWLLQ